MTDPARIQRIVEIAIDAALGEVARQQGGIAEPTGTEARESGVQAAMAIDASQAVAPPEPVVVEWRDDPGDPNYSAEVGPLVLAVWPSRLGGWGWTVTMMDRRVAEIGARSQGLPRDAAKTAAIAAARAWRDSIRL